MGSLATVIGLDLKLCATRAVGGLMGAEQAPGAGNDRLQMLEESVKSLEAERRKIEVFRRELPLCMRILTDVIDGLKKEMEERRKESFAERSEEFMPTKPEFEGEDEAKTEADCKEKMNWMSSAQLWCNNSDENKKDQKNKAELLNEGSDGQRPKQNSFLEFKSHRRSGAFVPFKGLETHGINVLPTPNPLHALSLTSPAIKSDSRPLSPIVEGHQSFSTVASRAAASAMSDGRLGLQTQHRPSRKARRCWSPELHRRFVLALQQLGGAQVTTPKQIREFMNVEGLTNDEVKSHLQKYRLHTRRPPCASAPAKLLVVAVAGSRPASSVNDSSSSEQSLTKSGSPQSTLQLDADRDSFEREDGKSESSNSKREF